MCYRGHRGMNAKPRSPVKTRTYIENSNAASGGRHHIACKTERERTWLSMNADGESGVNCTIRVHFKVLEHGLVNVICGIERCKPSPLKRRVGQDFDKAVCHKRFEDQDIVADQGTGTLIPSQYGLSQPVVHLLATCAGRRLWHGSWLG